MWAPAACMALQLIYEGCCCLKCLLVHAWVVAFLPLPVPEIPLCFVVSESLLRIWQGVLEVQHSAGHLIGSCGHTRRMTIRMMSSGRRTSDIKSASLKKFPLQCSLILSLNLRDMVLAHEVAGRLDTRAGCWAGMHTCSQATRARLCGGWTGGHSILGCPFLVFSSWPRPSCTEPATGKPWPLCRTHHARPTLRGGSVPWP